MDAIFSVGWNKGEMDFAVRGDLAALTLEQMNQWRVMVVVGIATAEDMWRREQERKTPAAQSDKKDYFPFTPKDWPT